MRKLGPLSFVSALLVISMIVASLAFLPADPADAVTGGNHFVVEVKDGAGHLAGATVMLTEAYGRIAPFSGLTGPDGNVTFAAAPGMYQVKINATGHYDDQTASMIRFDGIHDVHILVVLDQLGPLGPVSFNVTDGASAVANPSIALRSTSHGVAATSFSAQGTSGNVTLNIPAGTYKMIAKANGYVTNVSIITVTSLPSTIPVQMTATTYVNYTVNVSYSGRAVSDLKGFMVLKDGTGLDPEARITEARAYVGSVSFDVRPGTYIMLISADNMTTMESEVVVTVTEQKDGSLVARPSVPYTSAISFMANDWNHLSINESRLLAFDSSIPVLPYSSIPSMRMQAELAFGNGDGVLNVTETANYTQAIVSLGSYRVSTDNLIRVNSESYLSVPGNTSVSLSGLAGPVNSTSNLEMSVLDDYNVSGAPIGMGASSYTVNMVLEYNSDSVTHSYLVSPPAHHEVTGSATVTNPSRLAVSGSFNVSIASTTKIAGDPADPTATVVFQRSTAPIAWGAVTGPASFYRLVNVNSTYSYYIVANDSEMIFSAMGTYDANDPRMTSSYTYIWNFDDGTANVTTTFASARHKFTQAAFYRNVTLTVRDVADLTSTFVINLKVDDQNPNPVISMNGAPVSTIYANQKESFTFSQSLTTDFITGPSDPSPGAIHQYRWNWGDGSNPVTVLPSALQNVTHTFTKAGTFTVFLNVTDSVGHLASATMTAVVNDTEAPVPRITVSSGDVILSATIPERTMVTFNASTSTDSGGIIASFHWDFGDGTTDDGMYANHSFPIAGTYKVKLVATDASGNEGNVTKTFSVVYGIRPDLRILSIVVDPSSYVAGDTVSVRLNLVNVGSGNATGVYAMFYLVDLAGNRREIGNSSQLYVNGMATDRLGLGESGYITLNSTFASKGAFSLEAVAYSFDEVKVTDNEAKQSLSVGENGSMLPILLIVIVLIAIAAAVLFVFRKRIFGAKK